MDQSRSKSTSTTNRHARRAASTLLDSNVTGNYLLRRITSHFPARFERIVQKRGYPPLDREIAVAHEAGHLVVGAALGGTCSRTDVWEDIPGVWSGFSAMTIPGVNYRTINLETDPKWGERWGKYLVGGLAAEMVIRRFHPASSLHERSRFLEFCVELSSVQGKDAELVVANLLGSAVRTIRNNIAAFESVCATFATTNSADPQAVNDALRGVSLHAPPSDVEEA
ncbi:MAG: hypothetical protein O9972_53980 [Burkholderiales bacterium]|nr:hypothetical protein [Burkholderiales bacterium]